jgi:hypothetical protein
VLIGAVAIAGSGPTGGLGDSPTRAQINSSKNAARRGQYDEAWRRLGVRAGRKAFKRELRCAANSYGQVREFFVRMPCRSLRRMLLGIVDSRGNTVVLAIAWVRMPSASSAEQLKRLADRDGAGNVSPIATDVLELRGVRFTGQHYASRRTGPLTVIAEAAPKRGRPSPALLDGAAEVAVEYPPPP